MGEVEVKKESKRGAPAVKSTAEKKVKKIKRLERRLLEIVRGDKSYKVTALELPKYWINT